MVTIPDKRAFGARPSLRQPVGVQRQDTRLAGSDSRMLAEGLEQAARAVGDIGGQIEERKQKQARLAMSYAEAELIEKQTGLLNEFKQRDDYATFETEYQKRMEEARQEAAKQIEDEDLRQSFLANAQGMQARGLNSVLSISNTKHKEIGRARLTERLEAMKKAYMEAGDDDIRDNIATNIEMLVEESADNDIIGRDDAVSLRQSWVQDMAALQLSSLPVEQQKAMLDANAGVVQSMSEEDKVKFRKAVDSTLAKNQEERRQAFISRFEKPYEYLEAIGENPAPLQVESQEPGALAAALDLRRQDLSAIEEKHGIRPPLLTSTEAEMLLSNANAFENVQDKAMYFYGIGQEVGEQNALDMVPAFNKVDSDAAVAYAAALTSPETASLILAGAQRMKAKDIVLPSDNEFTEQLTKDFGQALQQPEARARVFDSIRKVYAEMAFAEQKTGPDIDDSILKKARRQVVGDTINVGYYGSKVFPFRMTNGEWVNEDVFDTILRDGNAEIFERAGQPLPYYRGEPLDIQDLYEYGTFTSAGYGKYLVTMRDGTTPSQNQSNYVVDMRKLYEAWLATEDKESIQGRSVRNRQAARGGVR